MNIGLLKLKYGPIIYKHFALIISLSHSHVPCHLNSVPGKEMIKMKILKLLLNKINLIKLRYTDWLELLSATLLRLIILTAINYIRVSIQGKVLCAYMTKTIFTGPQQRTHKLLNSIKFISIAWINTEIFNHIFT